MNRLLARKRPTRLLKDAPGDPGPFPVTKIGGIPFWPRGLDRPTCSLGHRMAFLAQIRLGDVPGWNDANGLLSLHYCVECLGRGIMSLGLEDRKNGPFGGTPGHVGYDVTVLPDPEANEADGLGADGTSSNEPFTVSFEEALEVEAMEEFWQPNGVYPQGNYPADYPIEPEDFAAIGLPDFSCRHQSKLGGWPSWENSADWPECPHGQPFDFVGQISEWHIPESAWAPGGFGYLWICPSCCLGRVGDLSCQSS